MMTPADLAAWRTRMGWLKGEAAAALGLSLNGYGAYERGWVWSRDEDQMVQAPRSIPKHVELACERLEDTIKARRQSYRLHYRSFTKTTD